MLPRRQISLDRSAVSPSDYQLVGSLLALAGLVTQSGLAPRCAGTGTSDRASSFTAAVRVVIRVHDGTSDGGTYAHVALSSCLTEIDQVVVDITHDTDCSSAAQGNHSHLA